MSMCSRVRLSRALTVVAAKLENVCLNVPGVHDGMGIVELEGHPSWAGWRGPKTIADVLQRMQSELTLRWLLILSTGALLVAAYFVGVARGLDSYVGLYDGGPFLLAVCATATKWQTGIGDYVCLRDILDIMQPIHGVMYDLGLRLDGSSWDFLFNRNVLIANCMCCCPTILGSAKDDFGASVLRHTGDRMGYGRRLL